VTRVEELTFKVADGFITDGEWSELERLVADPEAVRVVLWTLDLEAALRGQRRTFDVWRAVVWRLRRRLLG